MSLLARDACLTFVDTDVIGKSVSNWLGAVRLDREVNRQQLRSMESKYSGQSDGSEVRTNYQAIFLAYWDDFPDKMVANLVLLSPF